jgi:hypothetical protein
MSVSSSEFRANADDFTKAYVEAALWSSSANIGECGDRSGCAHVGVTDQNGACSKCGGETWGTDKSFQDREFDIENIAPETLDEFVADCAKFQTDNGHLITRENCNYDGCSADKYAGQDFWLTRNRHGCGFWDGHWEKPAATKLTDAAHAFGETDLSVGDDGLIYAN